MPDFSQIEIRNIGMQETSKIIIELENLPPHPLVHPDPELEPAQLAQAQPAVMDAQLHQHP